MRSPILLAFALAAFTGCGHLDLTDAILRGLRGRPAEEITAKDIGDAYEAQTKSRIASALAEKSDERCKAEFEDLARTAET
jgi:hypothetical protein